MDHEYSPWVHRNLKVLVRPATAVSVSRFVIDFAAKVKPMECEEACEPGCNSCMETGRNYQVICRLSVGPARRVEGQPDKCGVRLDSWCGLTHEPDAAKFEGVLIDEANEVIMTQGDVTMLKIPPLEEAETTAFPGLSLLFEWPLCDDPEEHDLHNIT